MAACNGPIMNANLLRISDLYRKRSTAAETAKPRDLAQRSAQAERSVLAALVAQQADHQRGHGGTDAAAISADFTGSSDT